MYNNKSLIGNFRGEGIYDRYQWENDANGYLFSSQTLRNSSKEKKLEFEQLRDKWQHKEIVNNIVQREYLNKTSLLLLGFALELFLKSGILALYIGAPKEAFDGDIKNRFNHYLDKIAKELCLDLCNDEYDMLIKMTNFIKKYIKYPLEINNNEDYLKTHNERAREIWDDERYDSWIVLYEKIKQQVKIIDHCTEDVMFGGYWEINSEEYIHYRRGGKLPPIIKTNCNIKIDKKTPETKSFILKNIDHIAYKIYIEKEWNNTRVYKITTGKPPSLKLIP
jgi:hypothetical protein